MFELTAPFKLAYYTLVFWINFHIITVKCAIKIFMRKVL